jgi:ribonuclease HI
MRFRGDTVWIKVDDGGRPLLDSEGRAEMKYRQEDPRSYRPSPGNLLPDASPGPGGAAPAATGVPAARAKTTRTTAASKTATAAKIAAAQRTGASDAAVTIHVWTDGACTGNPGPMGIGVVVLAREGEAPVRKEVEEFLGLGTNNIAELVAIERGLETAALIDPARGRPVRVYSDSAYSIGVVSMGWKAKANQELVARLRKLAATFSDLTFVKVAGHAGVPENERCDELARHAIESRGRT